MNTGMPLDKYEIVRTELKNEVGLLLGNGEMGGLGRNDGLGIDELWLSDYWSDATARAPIAGFHLSKTETDEGSSATMQKQGSYRQSLSLGDGILVTRVDASEGGYESRMFFCAKRPHVFVMQVRNIGKALVEWRLHVPAGAASHTYSQDGREISFACQTKADYMALPFTRAMWLIRANISCGTPKSSWGCLPRSTGHPQAPIRVQTDLGVPQEGVPPATFVVPPGEALTLHVAITTSFDGPDYESQAQAALDAAPDFDALQAEQKQAWQADWDRFSVVLPDGPHAEVFYRSIYYTFCITGDTRFLQGECQFADSGWKMHPFTIGTPTWAALALAAINHEDRARRILDKLYTPVTLASNAQLYWFLFFLGKRPLNQMGEIHGVKPFSFAHELDIAGNEIIYSFGQQRYLDGFAPAVFHRVSSTFDARPSADSSTYQVLRGCAAFWLRFAYWDERYGYLIPESLGLDEVVKATSSIVAVAACHWTLLTFARYAEELGADADMAGQSRRTAEKLYWPQHTERYLDYLGDDETRVVDQYNCVRSFSLLGYPFCELLALMDRDKLCRTLDHVQGRNRIGTGVFNTMTANMFALTEAFAGRGDKAYEFSGFSALRRMDPSGVAMCEAHNDSLRYFATGYASFVLAAVSMLLQSYDDVIRPFPAVPGEWKDVSFDNLPASRGIRVSGRMEGGCVRFVRYFLDGQELLCTPHARPVRIVRQGGPITLEQ